MRGLGPQDRDFVVGIRCLETGVAGLVRGGLLIAAVADSPRVAGPPPVQPTG
jgi:hypothetical protein